MRAATFSIACAIIALLAAPATAAPKKRPKPPTLVPFTATAAFGEDVEILKHGPMTLLFQCRAGSSVGDTARLAVVSTEADMLVTGEPSILVPAGDDRTLIYGSILADVGGGYVGADPRHSDFYGGGTSGGSAITPSGFVLTVPADATAFGVGTHRFSAVPHGWQEAPDCFVIGFAVLSKAAVLP
jgi:hypothetical protein